METVRVNICYRPMRICWAIADGDFASFRRAIRLNNTMWGGRYNPIAIVDRTDEAQRIVEVFRADMIVPLGDSPAAAEFPKKFPYLINPLFGDHLFNPRPDGGSKARVLDVHNALIEMQETPAWRAIKARGIRLFDWNPDDPLSDLLLMILGGYPDQAEVALDYRGILKDAGDATEHYLKKAEPLPVEILQHPTISYFSRHGLHRHYGIRSNWDYPGFYLGDVTNFHDLVTYWNLRATDTSLLFVDRAHLPRFTNILSEWTKTTNELLAGRRIEFQRAPAVWSRRDAPPADHEAHVAELKAIFGDVPFTICNVSIFSWNGLNLQAPLMILGDTSQMGILVSDSDRPKLSFALGEKPFAGDNWFHSQHLVASISFIGGLYNDDLHTLDVPYVPELNEYLGRTMHFNYNRLRLEPGRLGIIIDAADIDVSIYALPVDSLFEQIFKLTGLTAKPSGAGLIARQLITQLGGLRGAAVFKIPGVRRLLRLYGPTDTFAREAAYQEIGRRHAGDTNFGEFHDLFIEARSIDMKLSPPDVFTYLVDKGLFRIGADLKCPNCRMTAWVSLDALKQRVECDMCGKPFDATRQLLTGKYHFRRSGMMGAERNIQGAIPVALTLQQLDTDFHRAMNGNLYTTSLDLVPAPGSVLKPTEVDFVWLTTERYPEKVELILAECKDRGRSSVDGSADTITQDDIDRLKAVADALPVTRFDVFILLAKLSAFTPTEIAAAQTLNGPYHRRVIMLTPNELEPWHVFERIREDLKQHAYGGSAGQLANLTAAMYFPQVAPVPTSVPPSPASPPSEATAPPLG
jgi:hypothetical protein